MGFQLFDASVTQWILLMHKQISSAAGLSRSLLAWQVRSTQSSKILWPGSLDSSGCGIEIWDAGGWRMVVIGQCVLLVQFDV